MQTSNEYANRLGSKVVMPGAKKPRRKRPKPLRVDYRKLGYVTSVKNQVGLALTKNGVKLILVPGH